MQFPEITPLDDALRPVLQAAIDDKTKPLGALGRLESLALQLGLILGTARPVLQRPTVIVFAADHGVADAGVSAYPAEVTAQMVQNFLAGGAAINVFSRQHGIALEIVDAGVRVPLPAAPGLVNCRIADGTRNFAVEPAMAPEQAAAAMTAGMARVLRHAQQGCNVIGFGEMGIANTSAAACLMQRLTGLPLADCIGRGTGLDDAGLARKRACCARAGAACRCAGAAGRAGHLRRRLRDRDDGRRLPGRRREPHGDPGRWLYRHGRAAGGAALDPNVLQYCVFTHR